jgi:membrane protease YdiL (CAAX protease family)
MSALALGLLPPAAVWLTLRLGGTRSLWPVVLVYVGVCVAVPFFYRLGLQEAGLTSGGRKRWLLLSVAASPLLTVGIPVIGRWSYAYGFPPSNLSALLTRLEPVAFFGICAILVNPFVEEYYWRGFLLPRTGLLGSAAFFGLLHFAALIPLMRWPEALLLSVPPLAAGIAWGWMRRASDSLWPGIVTHAGADAGILLLLYLLQARG